MKRLKVATVVGTRPEIIRLARVLAKLDLQTEHILIHTGQNYDYELNEIFFENLRLRKPDYFLNAAGKNGAQTIGNVIIGADEALEKIHPDALLVLGDTNSCLAAIPAKRRKIPIFHMEAGNRCFDQRVPEEINRKIVDHTADINLTYSDIAREYLLREGIRPDSVIKTGSPMFEVLTYFKDDIEKSAVLKNLDLETGAFFVVSAHREENVDNAENLRDLIEVLNHLGEHEKKPIIFSAHPRTRKRIENSGKPLHPQIKMLKPLGFFDYVKLQTCAFITLSDSGTISEESSILNFRALNIRQAHERPEAMEEGSVMMVGLQKERILQAIDILRDQPVKSERLLRPVTDYSMPNVSDKVVRIIHSYVDYVNSNTWKKSR